MVALFDVTISEDFFDWLKNTCATLRFAVVLEKKADDLLSD